MKALKGIGCFVLVALALFIFGGLVIPAEWSVARSITIQASPEQIFPYVNDFQKWHQWSPWNESKDPSLKYTYSGPLTGPNSRQSWTSDKMGDGWMQMTASCQPMGVSYDLFIDMRGKQSNLSGVLLFKKMGEGTEVTWTDRGNSGNSWMNRWMSLMIQSMLGREMGTGLATLKTQVESGK